MKSRTKLAAAVALLAVGTAIHAADRAKNVWTFDDETTGQIAKGFTNEVGEWKVVPSDKGKALAQSAKNANPVFNVALIRDAIAKDVDVSVRVKALAGALDQGGGLVWRAKDAKNYYVVRYNPLEDNFRLYKVVDGKRTQIETANLAHSNGWFTLRVVMKGDRVECFYNGGKHLVANDATFTGPGKIGLWSKSDAQSLFDDLTLEEK